jgi:hypothetical protein
MANSTLTLTPDEKLLLKLEGELRIDSLTAYYERTHDGTACEYIEMWENILEQLNQ